MNTLRRHQLVWLNARGWREVLRQANDEQARSCVAHWARERWPLVVTRQRAGEAGDLLALGLPAPQQWERRRLMLQVSRPGIAYFDEFPAALEVMRLLPESARRDWRALCADLAQVGAKALVYGSYGWQSLTGLDHLRPGSDLDLLSIVSTPAQADEVTNLLAAHAMNRPNPRLDGELLFCNGAAVAWREWAAWRQGRSRSVLVKRTRDAVLVDEPFWEQREHMLEVCA